MLRFYSNVQRILAAHPSHEIHTEALETIETLLEALSGAVGVTEEIDVLVKVVELQVLASLSESSKEEAKSWGIAYDRDKNLIGLVASFKTNDPNSESSNKLCRVLNQNIGTESQRKH